MHGPPLLVSKYLLHYIYSKFEYNAIIPIKPRNTYSNTNVNAENMQIVPFKPFMTNRSEKIYLGLLLG